GGNIVVEADVPAAAIVGVVAREQVHVRVDADGEDVARAPQDRLEAGAVGPNACDAAAHGNGGPVLGGGGTGHAKIADGDVDPAVDAHGDAVGGVIAAARLDRLG